MDREIKEVIRTSYYKSLSIEQIYQLVVKSRYLWRNISEDQKQAIRETIRTELSGREDLELQNVQYFVLGLLMAQNRLDLMDRDLEFLLEQIEKQGDQITFGTFYELFHEKMDPKLYENQVFKRIQANFNELLETILVQSNKRCKQDFLRSVQRYLARSDQRQSMKNKQQKKLFIRSITVYNRIKFMQASFDVTDKDSIRSL